MIHEDRSAMVITPKLSRRAFKPSKQGNRGPTLLTLRLAHKPLKEQFDKILSYLEIGRQEGAVLTGGKSRSNRMIWVMVTISTNYARRQQQDACLPRGRSSALLSQ
ncbi:hypothetical protein OK016_29835 [Vibrio chagasii]|nr:hypothetical protein [Vibrio chagasii]